MDSKEFGLVAAQQLLQVQDLHYGFWEKGTETTNSNFLEAQLKHTSFLFGYIDKAIDADKSRKILDSGCGIGITTSKLLKDGYRVDGLVPANWMAIKARENIQKFKDDTKGEIFECTLENYPITQLKEKYQTVFFSESYQYVNMQKAFDVFQKILTDNGTVVIFDFFCLDGVKGKSPLGGGHSLEKFYELVNKNGYKIETDLDVTKNLSPNLSLLNDMLITRFIPFIKTLDLFLTSKHPKKYNFIKYIFRKKLKKMKYKYSHRRNAENFEKFKTYRLIVLNKI